MVWKERDTRRKELISKLQTQLESAEEYVAYLAQQCASLEREREQMYQWWMQCPIVYNVAMKQHDVQYVQQYVGNTVSQVDTKERAKQQVVTSEVPHFRADIRYPRLVYPHTVCICIHIFLRMHVAILEY